MRRKQGAIAAGEGAVSCSLCEIDTVAPLDGDGTLCVPCNSSARLYSGAAGPFSLPYSTY